MKMTAPLAYTAGELWVFITYSRSATVDAGRLGLDPETGDYFLFSPCTWITDAVVPTLREDGEPVSHIRWADTSDLDGDLVPFMDGDGDSLGGEAI